MLREAHPLGGHTVEVRRVDTLLPVAAEVPITEVIGDDEDDIGRALRCAGVTGAKVKRRDHDSEQQQRVHGLKMESVVVAGKGAFTPPQAGE